MNRRNTLTLATMALLCFTVAVPAGDAAAQQKSLKEQLVGAWTLVSVETTMPNGVKRQVFGANPKGILILDASGRYAVMTMRPDRPKLKGSSTEEAPAVEVAEAARGFRANFGTWSVNEADKTLIRRFEGDLNPNQEGIEQKVSVSPAGDELKFVFTLATGARVDNVYRRAK